MQAKNMLYRKPWSTGGDAKKRLGVANVREPRRSCSKLSFNRPLSPKLLDVSCSGEARVCGKR